MSTLVARRRLRAHVLMGRALDRAFTASVRGSFAEFGDGSLLRRPCRLSRTEHVRIGQGVMLGAGSWLQVEGEPAAGAVVIDIGDRVSVTGSLTISAAVSVSIGAGALLARGIYISDHSHHYTDHDLPVRDQGITALSAVVLEEGCWLGQNVVINPGVTIGRGAVVGANSVVTSSVPPQSLAVGAPARVVKTW